METLVFNWITERQAIIVHADSEHIQIVLNQWPRESLDKKKKKMKKLNEKLWEMVATEDAVNIDTSTRWEGANAYEFFNSIGTRSNQISILWHNSIMKRLLKLTQPKRKTNWRNAMVRHISVNWMASGSCPKAHALDAIRKKTKKKTIHGRTKKCHWRKRITHFSHYKALMMTTTTIVQLHFGTSTA